jgi:hypothetical protein
MDRAPTAGALLKAHAEFDADQFLLRYFDQSCADHVGGSFDMPTGSLLLSIAVCGVFLAFAAVLAWIDHSTSGWQRDQVADKPAGKPVSAAAPPHKKAA